MAENFGSFEGSRNPFLPSVITVGWAWDRVPLFLYL
jgi:hypothetical protein